MDTEIVERVSRNIVRVDVKINDKWGNGSGLIIDEKGTVLTCDHVVHPDGLLPEDISVVKGSELPKKGDIIDFDQNHDLATIKVNDIKIDGTLNHISYEETKVGQACFFLGYPLGLPHLALGTATISAKGKVLTRQFHFDLIQIDGRVNGGNSGGPLFSEGGRVVGIITMKYIPFFEEIRELQKYINSFPALSGVDIDFGGVSISRFINNANEGVRRMTHALDIVQVGIGWVIPIQFALDFLAK